MERIIVPLWDICNTSASSCHDDGNLWAHGGHEGVLEPDPELELNPGTLLVPGDCANHCTFLPWEVFFPPVAGQFTNFGVTSLGRVKPES